MKCKTCNKVVRVKLWQGECPTCNRQRREKITHYPDWTYNSKLENCFYYENDEGEIDEDRPY